MVHSAERLPERDRSRLGMFLHEAGEAIVVAATAAVAAASVNTATHIG